MSIHGAPKLPPTVSVSTAAHILGVSRATAYNAVHSGDLPHIRIRRRIVIPTHRLLAMIAGEPPKAD